MATGAIDMTPLGTARLDLVPLDPDRDAPSLHALYGDPEHDPYGPDGASRDEAGTRERLVQMLAENGGLTWAIRLRPDEQAIGAIGVFSDQGRSIRGLSWYLLRAYWGRGLMGEAAPVVVEYLLAQPAITGVEAWIDTRNLRSIGVARRARLTESARMARVYADHTAQQVVMTRAAEPRDDDVVAVRLSLMVTDVRATAVLLTQVLGLHLAFEHPDPPTMARLLVSPWSGSPGIDLHQATGPIHPSGVTVEVGVPTDLVHRRAVAAGLEIADPPQDQPWYRRTCTLLLPEGHRIAVHGPLRPEREVAGS